MPTGDRMVVELLPLELEVIELLLEELMLLDIAVERIVVATGFGAGTGSSLKEIRLASVAEEIEKERG